MPDGRVTPAPTNRTLRLVGPSDPIGGETRAEYALRGWVDPDGRRRPDTDRELRVAPLTAEDEEQLRDGVLALSTPAGRTIGTAARDVTDMRVGVALGGGSIRGWAHIGVLAQLEHVGVPVDYIVGTSIGAIVASSYGFGHTPDESAEQLYRASAKIFRVRLPRASILSNSGVKRGLATGFGDGLIEDTGLPLAVTATDIVQQREVVLRSGLLWEGALASMSIPGVFPPYEIGPYLLVDGGVVNPVPSNVLADMGANVLIGVKLTRSLTRTARTQEARQEAEPDRDLHEHLRADAEQDLDRDRGGFDAPDRADLRRERRPRPARFPGGTPFHPERRGGGRCSAAAACGVLALAAQQPICGGGIRMTAC